MITIKSKREIEYMRAAGKIVAETLHKIQSAICTGVTTLEINDLADSYIRSMGAEPSFLGYNGFPKSICISINNEVVHGIPDNRNLINGDIIGVDVGVIFNNYHSDAARTFVCGTASDDAVKLIEVTKQSFFEGIKFAVDGNRLSDISSAIQVYVEKHGFSVVRDLVGHGIGRHLHEEPQIPNFGIPGKGPRIYRGMTFAIEPMVNQGTFLVDTLPNRWTVVTKDGKLSAHYENTILITKEEPMILSDI